MEWSPPLFNNISMPSGLVGTRFPHGAIPPNNNLTTIQSGSTTHMNASTLPSTQHSTSINSSPSPHLGVYQHPNHTNNSNTTHQVHPLIPSFSSTTNPVTTVRTMLTVHLAAQQLNPSPYLSNGLILCIVAHPNAHASYDSDCVIVSCTEHGSTPKETAKIRELCTEAIYPKISNDNVAKLLSTTGSTD